MHWHRRPLRLTLVGWLRKTLRHTAATLQRTTPNAPPSDELPLQRRLLLLNKLAGTNLTKLRTNLFVCTVIRCNLRALLLAKGKMFNTPCKWMLIPWVARPLLQFKVRQPIFIKSPGVPTKLRPWRPPLPLKLQGLLLSLFTLVKCESLSLRTVN